MRWLYIALIAGLLPSTALACSAELPPAKEDPTWTPVIGARVILIKEADYCDGDESSKPFVVTGLSESPCPGANPGICIDTRTITTKQVRSVALSDGTSRWIAFQRLDSFTVAYREVVPGGDQ